MLLGDGRRSQWLSLSHKNPDSIIEFYIFLDKAFEINPMIILLPMMKTKSQVLLLFWTLFNNEIEGLRKRFSV